MAFDLNEFWDSESREHTDVAAKTFASQKVDFQKLLNASTTCINGGGKLLFFGNGGSAADAQHLATEFAVRYVKSRAPIAALALTTDTSSLTAIGNDYGFEDLFARQVEALGKKGDLAI
ncbi:MAG TPA: SIS domain-containing protein, partial [Pyrinomonadaceae bacterium]|nr:SIS domain-containing protein [Pyrinomonadaceae bacterium]